MSPAYRHLGVTDVRALGDELNRFGVLCVGLPAIPAPGLIPDPPGLDGSRRRTSAGCLVQEQDDGGDALLPSGGDALPPSFNGRYYICDHFVHKIAVVTEPLMRR